MTSPAREDSNGQVSANDVLEYGLPAIARALSNSKSSKKRGFFFLAIHIKFASEVEDEVLFEQTYMNHEELVIEIRIPDPKDEAKKEEIRSLKNREYTALVDETKARAARYLWDSFEDHERYEIVRDEKERIAKLKAK